MKTSTSLRRNVSWTLFGNVVYALCLWGAMSLLAKLGRPELVGRYAIGSLVVGPVMMFANLELRSVQATDARGAYRFADYLGLRTVMIAVALAAAAGIGVLGYDARQALVVAAFALMRGIESVGDVFHGFAQKHDRMDLVSGSFILKGLLGISLFAGGYLLLDSLPAALLGMALGHGLTVTCFDLPRHRRLRRGPVGETEGRRWRPRWDRATMLALFRLTLPLGLGMLLVQLRNTIPRAFLEAGFGEQELGIFSALAYVIVAGDTVVLAVSQSSIARLSRLYAEGAVEEFKRLQVRLAGFGALLGLGGMAVAAAAGPPLLEFLYTPEYAARSGIFVLLMVAGAVYYVGSLLGAGATAMRAFRAKLLVNLINVPVMGGLALALIPRLGMTGAAWTMLGSGLWLLLGQGLIVARGLGDASPGEG